MTEIPASFPSGSFMGNLDEADRLELLRGGRRMTLPAGASLLFEGDLSDRVVVVLQGAVRVFATAANGREVLVTMAGPGEILAEMSAVDGQAHSASVTTVDDAVIVLVPAGSFRAVMQANPTVSFAVALRLTRELRRVLRQRVGFEPFDVPTRLAQVMVSLADRLGTAATRSTCPSRRESSQNPAARRAKA
jgi:CRP/FNR family cyclic AMP-dependent transcriptional regulator